MNTHKKKVQNLTRNAILPFTSSYAIPPKFISKTEVFTSFRMINRFLQSEVKSEELKPPLKAELAHLARIY